MKRTMRKIRPILRKIWALSLPVKVFGTLGIVFVSTFVITFVPNLVENTKAVFEKKASTDVQTTNGELNFKVYSINTDAAAAIPLATFGNSTIDASGSVMDPTELGSTKTLSGTSSFGLTKEFKKLSPGDIISFGYSFQNIGTMDEILNFVLDTDFVDPYLPSVPLGTVPAQDAIAYMGADARTKISFYIYQGDTANGTYTRLNATALKLSDFDQSKDDAANTLTSLSPTTASVLYADDGDAGTNEVQQKYFIIVMQFADGLTPSDNFSGDNVYQGSITNLKFTIKGLRYLAP